MQTHPESGDTIYAKQKEINEEWTGLTAKANARKEKLLDSYDLQRFLSDYRLANSFLFQLSRVSGEQEINSAQLS